MGHLGWVGCAKGTGDDPEVTEEGRKLGNSLKPGHHVYLVNYLCRVKAVGKESRRLASSQSNTEARVRPKSLLSNLWRDGQTSPLANSNSALVQSR